MTIKKKLEFKITQGYSEALDILAEEIPNRNPQVLIEALKNAFRYGNHTKGKVEVIVARNAKSTRITIKDFGRGFEWRQYMNKDYTEEDLWKETGKGIYIMRKFSDKVLYNEKGNTIMLEFLN